MDIADDPRFHEAIVLFNREEFLESNDLFEELFFEAVRDEVEFARLFMQLSVGIHHVERGQLIGAVDRLHEALRAVENVTNPRGFDLETIRSEIERLVAAIERRRAGDRTPMRWPKL